MHRQNGNVLFYILIAVVLLASLTYVVARGGGENASSIASSRISEDIKAQAQSIRAAILECNLVNNFGYPLDPDVPTLVADLACQVDAAPTYEVIFSSSASRFLPVPPAPFVTGWTYRINTATDPDTIYIELTEAVDCAANQALKSALNILQTQFTAAEVSTTCSGATAAFRLNIVVGS